MLGVHRDDDYDDYHIHNNGDYDDNAIHNNDDFDDNDIHNNDDYDDHLIHNNGNDNGKEIQKEACKIPFFSTCVLLDVGVTDEIGDW
ncbi:hypothetical protein O0I10_007377 [Lichtheimia ornata]|uniref:Uncharacterized protein n=1 Tax=Lichtheimia ornata TaxID=688661 RepID=A0AAD7V1Q9_9FUNG|nr:uncharacterized protein O0I10_007377 [Lichtheimia ornata]KAJ8657043.1 hypothetical protein O0I10_007377 [Lichtheimia ornata]